MQVWDRSRFVLFYVNDELFEQHENSLESRFFHYRVMMIMESITMEMNAHLLQLHVRENRKTSLHNAILSLDSVPGQQYCTLITLLSWTQWFAVMCRKWCAQRLATLRTRNSESEMVWMLREK